MKSDLIKGLLGCLYCVSHKKYKAILTKKKKNKNYNFLFDYSVQNLKWNFV